MTEKNRSKKGKSKKTSKKPDIKSKSRKNKFESKKKKTFKGETLELSKHVFETFGESKNATQYETTIKALQVYVANNFRHGGDIGWMLKHEQDFELTRPNAPSGSTRSSSTVDQDIYKEKIKGYVARMEKYTENKHKLYSVIWGQCSDSMQSKLQNKDDFDRIDEDHDCLRLLKEIKGVMFNFESEQYPIISMHQATYKYVTARQGKFKTLTEYYKRFKTIVEVLEHYGANIWLHPSLILKEYHRNSQSNITINQIHRDWGKYQKHSKTVKNRAIAYAFMKGAQHNQYGHLMYNLKSQYSRNFKKELQPVSPRLTERS